MFSVYYLPNISLNSVQINKIKICQRIIILYRFKYYNHNLLHLPIWFAYTVNQHIIIMYTVIKHSLIIDKISPFEITVIL